MSFLKETFFFDEKIPKHFFLNSAMLFFFYAMLALLVFSTISAIQVRGEAQGVFVLIPLALFGLIVSPLVLLVRIYLRIKKTELSKSFMRVSSLVMWIPLVAFIVLLFLVS